MSRNEFRTLRDVAVAHAERAPDATLLIAPAMW
jgi:hypothetical protein